MKCTCKICSECQGRDYFISDYWDDHLRDYEQCESCDGEGIEYLCDYCYEKEMEEIEELEQ